MRKFLLMTASVLVLGTGAAMADGSNGGGGGGNGGGPKPTAAVTFEQYLALAAAVNAADATDNSFKLGNGNVSSASIASSFQGASGVANQNQNAGADSVLQNSLALAYVQGCACGTTVGTGSNQHTGSTGNAASFAAALNFSTIDPPSGPMPPTSPGTSATSAAASISAGSYNHFTGSAQVNQNAGADSVLQNATALAVVKPVSGSFDQDKAALGLAANLGSVQGTASYETNHNTNASISDSFNNATGQVNVNQNVAVNSLMQNSTALSSIEYCGCATNDLSVSAALAVNVGESANNAFSASGGTNAANMSNSFNAATGIVQVSQNAGANSLLQNAVSVANITQVAH